MINRLVNLIINDDRKKIDNNQFYCGTLEIISIMIIKQYCLNDYKLLNVSYELYKEIIKNLNSVSKVLV